MRDLTLHEVTRLDAGSWFGPQFRGARIPTLEQLLDLARGANRILVLEAKGSDGGETRDIAVAIGDARSAIDPQLSVEDARNCESAGVIGDARSTIAP